MTRFCVSIVGILVGTATAFAQDTPMVPVPNPLAEVPVVEILSPTILEEKLPSRHHYSLDFVQYLMRDLNVPPLVTTGPAGSQAIVGQPGTEVLRGDGRLPSRHGRYIGVRGSGEWWLNDALDVGIDLTVTFFERDSSNKTYDWTTGVLARPFINANTGQWDSFLVAGPGAGRFPGQTGSINVYSRMELYHEDANFVFNMSRSESGEANLLLGAHFTQFRERLDIVSASRVLPAQSTLTSVEDHIQTFNKFYGLQVGMKGRTTRGRWTLDGRGVIALGIDDQEIRTKGFTLNQTPASRDVYNYGLYFLPSNTGSFSRIAFDMFTEWNANLTYAMSERFSFRFGYNILTWNNPVRPSDQIQPINLNQLTGGGGPVAPTIPFASDFFWAHGFNIGMDFRW